MHQSLLYKKLDNKMVACGVCSHFCKIAPGRRGICGVRENQDGKLVVLNYGRIIANHIDPIEKKPLYHFLPGTETYSIAAMGCNFQCLNCQNAEISQLTVNSQQLTITEEMWGDKFTPEQIVKLAIESNCPSISYTYTEPTVFVEFALECMKLAREKDLKNIWVSNGYMSSETLDLVLPYLNAINVDLKSFSGEFYQRVCGAKLQPVLDNLVALKKAGIHLEVTTLIISDQNDSVEELKNLAEFIVKKLGAETPWHVSRFFPYYKMSDVPPTSKEKINEAVKIGKNIGLKFVYGGNL
ncbi:MAG: AmmeMemoRadiSam system radical SAM enzyme [Patescibacteria group bacterium]|nr:AmmeMemoRadiSam system radical SAM enzyme [Patescibacteria group bacterium]